MLFLDKMVLFYQDEYIQHLNYADGLSPDTDIPLKSFIRQNGTF